MNLPEPVPWPGGALDRTLLNLFVFGPGYGEALALALPGKGWIVVDGCRSGDRIPLLELLRDHPEEPIEAVVLTHPHTDHTAGMLDLLTDGDIGPRIRKIGCVARNITSDPDNTLGAELEARTDSLNPLDAEELEALGQARLVIERLRTEWEDTPSRRLPLVDGDEIFLSATKVRVKALAPTADDVTSFFAGQNLPARIRSRANDLSLVLKVDFGETTLLLGGDLPRTEADLDKAIASGWLAVAGRHDPLSQHVGLKVPHHASRAALGDELLGATASKRTWVVTPWNKGKGLPRFDVDQGARVLLAREPEFMLTALPVSIARQQPQPVRVSVDTLHPAVQKLKKPSKLLAGAVRASEPEVNPSECCWLPSFDDQGQLVSRGRGTRAMLVVA